MLKRIINLLFFLMLAYFLNADVIGDRLEVFAKENAESYLQPLANSMGAGLNSGFFNTARVLKPFRPSVMLGSTIVMIPSGDKKFTAKSPSSELYYDAEETATIFGKNGSVFRSKFGSYNDIRLPKGANLDMLAVPLATVSLGLPKGNEILLRGFPSVELSKDIGKIGFWGIGLKHSIDQYFTKLFPVDWSVQGVYQQMSIGDLLSLNTMEFNTQVSKSFFNDYCIRSSGLRKIIIRN